LNQSGQTEQQIGIPPANIYHVSGGIFLFDHLQTKQIIGDTQDRKTCQKQPERNQVNLARLEIKDREHRKH
jgi:hypothetical protein